MVPDRTSIRLRVLTIAIFSAIMTIGTIALQRNYYPDTVEISPDVAKANALLNELPSDGELDHSPSAAARAKSQAAGGGSATDRAAASSVAGASSPQVDMKVRPTGAMEKEGGSSTIRIMVAPPMEESPIVEASDVNSQAVVNNSEASKSDSLSSNQPRAVASAGALRPVDTLPRGVLTPVDAQSANVTNRSSSNALATVEPLELMRQLRGDDAAQQKLARDELLRRGFNQVELELSKQLLDPSVEVRKRLAVTVPRLTSVDAVPWLLWLSQDPEPSVRYVALSTLGTTGDPSLLQRVEDLARSDHDPQVQALADRIARQQDAASRRGELR
jgi:hypothetical protein